MLRCRSQSQIRLSRKKIQNIDIKIFISILKIHWIKEQRTLTQFLFLNFWRTWVLFVGSLIPLFWTSGDVSSGFQSQSGFYLIHTWRRHMSNVTHSLRFTSGATPADLLAASMAAEPITDPIYTLAQYLLQMKCLAHFTHNLIWINRKYDSILEFIRSTVCNTKQSFETHAADISTIWWNFYALIAKQN